MAGIVRNSVLRDAIEPERSNRAERSGTHVAGIASATPAELLQLPAEQLLFRLFHEEQVRLHGPHELAFGCRCSRERVAGMLRSIGREEAEAAVREDGTAEVTCEFCNRRYAYAPDAARALFVRDDGGAAHAVSRLRH